MAEAQALAVHLLRVVGRYFPICGRRRGSIGRYFPLRSSGTGSMPQLPILPLLPEVGTRRTLHARTLRRPRSSACHEYQGNRPCRSRSALAAAWRGPLASKDASKTIIAGRGSSGGADGAQDRRRPIIPTLKPKRAGRACRTGGASKTSSKGAFISLSPSRYVLCHMRHNIQRCGLRKRGF